MLKYLLFLTLAVILSGCNRLIKPQPTPTPTPATTIEAVKNASDQITEAFQSGASLKCDVTKEGEANSHYLIKDKKIKMMTDATEQQPERYFSLMDKENIYFWSSDIAQPGIKMSVKEVKENDNQFDNKYQEFPDISDPKVREEFENSGFTMNCTQQTIEDSEFLPPSDIKFNDLMEMFEGFKEQTTSSAAE